MGTETWIPKISSWATSHFVGNSLVETAAEEPSQREKVKKNVLPQPFAGTASEEQMRESPKANHRPHRFENSV